MSKARGTRAPSTTSWLPLVVVVLTSIGAVVIAAFILLGAKTGAKFGTSLLIDPALGFRAAEPVAG